MKRQLKKSVVYFLYGISFLLLFSGVAILSITTRKVEKETVNYVSKGILDYEENIKVISNLDIIRRPYNEKTITIVKNYYDYLSDESSQEKALLYYKDTYMQSSGVAYSNGSSFNVIAILSGTVKQIKEDTTLGNIITIEHENGIISNYQSITEISVKEGDIVNQGDVIAKSSTSNISSELENHLYFELIVNGTCVNPENYYEKSINDV